MRNPAFYLSLMWLGAIGVLANLAVAVWAFFQFGEGCEPPLTAAVIVGMLTIWLTVPYRHFREGHHE